MHRVFNFLVSAFKSLFSRTRPESGDKVLDDAPVSMQDWKNFQCKFNPPKDPSTMAIVTGQFPALTLDLLVYSKLVKEPNCSLSSNDNTEFAFFTDLVEYEEFTKWRTAMRDRFFGGNMEMVVPVVIEGEKVSGWMVTHDGSLDFDYERNSRSSTPSDMMVATWIWIVENCQGRIWFTDETLIFTNEDDYALHCLAPPHSRFNQSNSSGASLRGIGSKQPILPRSKLSRM